MHERQPPKTPQPAPPRGMAPRTPWLDESARRKLRLEQRELEGWMWTWLAQGDLAYAAQAHGAWCAVESLLNGANVNTLGAPQGSPLEPVQALARAKLAAFYGAAEEPSP